MNEHIRIISSDFNLLGEIDDYESLIFIRRFFKVGEFELHININKNNTDKLQEGNLILLGAKVNKVGIIMHRENGIDENGEATETLVIKGPTLKGVMKRRITVPTGNQAYDNAVGSQETIMKQFVNNNIVNPSDISRKISQVVIAPDLKRGKEDKWRTRFENLADKLTDIGEYSELGWEVLLDINNAKWIFDVVEGKSLTANQDILPPVIFSLDFDNIKNRHYIESSLDYKNVGYCGGKGEEDERLIQQVGEASGLHRTEIFIDCSQAENVEELTIQGQQKLNEFKKVKSFEVQIIPYSSFNFQEDYDLGDMVTVQDRKLGITMNTRIIELKEIYEENFNLEATFGINIPNLITAIKRETKKVVR
ncbi:siphovirus ReqiPepy6 Gp37-like family protein [Clostridium ganghwense]|uniref:Siphovirus ReqiPepy6 Gp37-like family protein n=1 Tax=Clostridium ganghwense TaxID=312089 RepID=A0ABT4CTR9_9CLOT|nr:siphovirus ReqiPepy6 Gp37-like family protein [Clostridium ganghwense]MCY6372470.1 siphovirus ReqiPepy6 Gp37-like family protein [Clostridium ganghwense]